MNKGGDAPCPESVPSVDNTTQSANVPASNAAPNVQPAGCGTVAWLIEELKKWPSDATVYVDFDREGGNEYPADTIEPYREYGVRNGIKIS